MSEELERLKSDYTTKLKKLKLLEAGIDITDVNTYIKYISADNEDEIEKQAQELVTDIRQHHFTATAKDKNVWRPF